LVEINIETGCTQKEVAPKAVMGMHFCVAYALPQ